MTSDIAGLVLHQFALSHYCEKVRWALAYKGVPFTTRNLLPGWHANVARKLSGQRSLPVLEIEAGVGLHESSAILDWIDAQYPHPPLIPADEALANEVREWERYLDTELGPHVRVVCYGTLLEHKQHIVSLLGHNTRWYGKPVLRLIFSRLRKLMRQGYKINDESVAASREKIATAIDELNNARDSGLYLVNGSFTRADLTAAALLAPLTGEPAYEIPWPDPMPEPLATTMAGMRGDLEWVGKLYGAHHPG